MRPTKLLKYTGEARLGELCVIRGRDRGFVFGVESTEAIVEITSCIVSPRTAFEENNDTGGAGVRIVTGNEE